MSLMIGCLMMALPAAGLGCWLLAAPAAAAAALRRLPRHAWAGRLLSAAALLWAGWVVHAAPLEFLLPYRRLILPATLVAIPLTWIAMPELLACRAIGGLLALLPAPVLLVVRSHPSPLRLVIVVLMYVSAIVGMLLIMSPWHLRRWLDWAAGGGAARGRAVGAACLGLGLIVAAAGIALAR